MSIVGDGEMAAPAAARNESARPLNVVDLGTLEYGAALEIQEQVLGARITGAIGDTLLLVEHPAVLTIGKHTDSTNIVASDDRLLQLGVDVVQTTRGGDVTYHGPGQLVAYPIINLRDQGLGVRDYVHKLEQCVAELLAVEYGIPDAQGSDVYPGVWVGTDKVAAIGVAVRRSVTFHGVALNANTELSAFNLIVPCGIEGRGVTSIASISGSRVDMGILRAQLAHHFAAVFNCAQTAVSLESLLGTTSDEDVGE